MYSFQTCIRNIHLKLSDFVDFVYDKLDKGEIQFDEFTCEQRVVNEMFTDYLKKNGEPNHDDGIARL